MASEFPAHMNYKLAVNVLNEENLLITKTSSLFRSLEPNKQGNLVLPINFIDFRIEEFSLRSKICSDYVTIEKCSKWCEVNTSIQHQFR